jgi:hypothetical protein
MITFSPKALWFALPHTGHSWIFEPVNLTDFSQFSSFLLEILGIGSFWCSCHFRPILPVHLYLSSHKNHHFQRLFIIFIPITPIILSEKILIGSNPSMAVQTTVKGMKVQLNSDSKKNLAGMKCSWRVAHSTAKDLRQLLLT